MRDAALKWRVTRNQLLRTSLHLLVLIEAPEDPLGLDKKLHVRT